jgi:hypothetical protein
VSWLALRAKSDHQDRPPGTGLDDKRADECFSRKGQAGVDRTLLLIAVLMPMQVSDSTDRDAFLLLLDFDTDDEGGGGCRIAVDEPK